MFGLGKKSRNPAISEASTDQLRQGAAALLELSDGAMRAAELMVVSPGSATSQEFVQRVEELCVRLRAAPWDPDESHAAQEEFTQLAASLGEWQRRAVSELQKELVAHVRQVVHASRQAFEGQDEFLGEFQSTSRELEQAQKCNDLDQLRAALRSGLQGLNGLVERQTEKLREQRKTFEAELKELEGQLGQVETTGSVDYLTNIANRASLAFYLQTTCQKARLTAQPFSLAMIDLDDFKKINDELGHEAGDRALNTIVEHLKDELGPNAFLARYGGDEFVAVFVGTSQQLQTQLEALEARLAGKRFQLCDCDHEGTELSMSVGVVEIKRDDHPSAVLKRADAAMYKAKKNGKGRLQPAA